MRIPTKVALASIATTAALVIAGAGFGAASASSRPAASPAVKAVTAAAAAPAVTAKTGWQPDYTYDVPTGTGELFFHYSCPTGMIATSGGFNDHNVVGAPALDGNFPRSDITPLYSQWGWLFYWASGSPAGYQITFNVFCKKS